MRLNLRSFAWSNDLLKYRHIISHKRLPGTHIFWVSRRAAAEQGVVVSGLGFNTWWSKLLPFWLVHLNAADNGGRLEKYTAFS